MQWLSKISLFKIIENLDTLKDPPLQKRGHIKKTDVQQNEVIVNLKK